MERFVITMGKVFLTIIATALLPLWAVLALVFVLSFAVRDCLGELKKKRNHRFCWGFGHWCREYVRALLFWYADIWENKDETA